MRFITQDGRLMANAINYEEMLKKIKETGKSELFIRTQSHLELA